MKSLRATQHPLSNTQKQLELLNTSQRLGWGIPSFEQKLEESGLFPLRPTGVDILQINVGKLCNQTCRHCHVDAGPDRHEVMNRATMEHCLRAVQEHGIKTVDITGGAPEMAPDFRWLVHELRQCGAHVMVRCNLTIILANPKYHDLPEFYASQGVEVISSLPYFAASRTDAQRGEGVFEKSIQALKKLNQQGYGQAGSSLVLNLVYNPSGAFLPGDQTALEGEFKRRLKRQYDIDFNQLFAITNLPISRFLDYLIESGNYQAYMSSLADAFNPMAAQGVMCRNTVSVGWDGFLYDCDFNQMLDLNIGGPEPLHIRHFDPMQLAQRQIITNQHCYGCTAGAGSSCGGVTV